MDLFLILANIAASLQLTAVLIYFFGVARKTKIVFNKGPIILTISMIVIFIQELFGIGLYIHHNNIINYEWIQYIHMFVFPMVNSIFFIMLGIKKIKYIVARDNNSEIVEMLNNAKVKHDHHYHKEIGK